MMLTSVSSMSAIIASSSERLSLSDVTARLVTVSQMNCQAAGSWAHTTVKFCLDRWCIRASCVPIRRGPYLRTATAYPLSDCTSKVYENAFAAASLARAELIQSLNPNQQFKKGDFKTMNLI